MSDFKAKMHQIRSRMELRLAPNPATGVYSPPQIPCILLREGRGEKGRGMEGEREREGQGWGEGGKSVSPSKFVDPPLLQWHIRKIGLVCHRPYTATIPPVRSLNPWQDTAQLGIRLATVLD